MSSNVSCFSCPSSVMRVLCLCSSFLGVTQDLLLNCLMEGLRGWRNKEVVSKNMGLIWDVFLSLSVWSSPFFLVFSFFFIIIPVQRHGEFTRAYLPKWGTYCTVLTIFSVWRYGGSRGQCGWCVH